MHRSPSQQAKWIRVRRSSSIVCRELRELSHHFLIGKIETLRPARRLYCTSYLPELAPVRMLAQLVQRYEGATENQIEHLFTGHLLLHIERRARDCQGQPEPLCQAVEPVPFFDYVRAVGRI